MEGKRYKGLFIYYDPKTQEEWTDTEWCYAYNLEQAKEILKKRNPNLIWVCSEDNKEGWHIKEDNPEWKSRTETLYDINNKQVYESVNMKKQTIKLNEENINSESWNNKIDMLLRTLQYLKDHLENGLFVVDGFVGGQRMEAINRIGLCCMALNEILDKGGITLTDKSVPVASPYKLNESQLRNIIKESIKKVLRENFRKPENWKDTPFKGTYQDEDGSIYMPDDDYEVIDEENK